MGMLVDGKWEVTPVTQGAKGEEGGKFVRRPSSFRRVLTADEAKERGRWHLAVSLACPWAHRTLVVRHLKGLENLVSVSIVDAHMGKDGWKFTPPDDVTGAEYLRELYVRADGKYTGKVTVPVLWDKREETIVNNESLDIIKMFDEVFPSTDPRLYPAEHRAAIDEMIDANYESVNNGVYKAGFATDQRVYEEAFEHLFTRLDVLDVHLSRRRWLVADRITLADVCLFTTLLRFDPVYVGHFKCNLRRIADYAHLSGYLRDIYQHLGIAVLCNFEHIKEHYYTSHESINPTRIVPLGPLLDLDKPAGRDKLP